MAGTRSVIKDDKEFSGSYLTVDWANKPGNVHAYSTLISGGFSTGDYVAFNLAAHVGDELTAVTANRAKLKAELKLTTEPVWLEQVHGDVVVEAAEYCRSTSAVSHSTQSIPQADASVARVKGMVCAVLTADCLPVFICNTAGTEVAVAHAGWRGLHTGIISATITKMHSSVGELQVSLGPAIGAQVFEVGNDVKQAFAEKKTDYLAAFSPVDAAKNNKHYLCDIYQLARIELALLGVNPARITGGQYCTFSEVNRFYSFRRQKQTGRMANLIWLS